MNWNELYTGMLQGNWRSLARLISLVENEVTGYESFLEQLTFSTSPVQVLGITGPPGAGKSTLTDALIAEMVKAQKRVAVLCVDPSSPFNLGALLGDRIRMSDWYNHPLVFIRSLATRGSLGGLHPKIIEISDVVKASCLFDYIIVETVGVGQSEIEIAGLADCTIVTLVPEAGDDIQAMKSGLMEIADIFVVNKCDRPDADLFAKNISTMLMENNKMQIPLFKTIASNKQGVAELLHFIQRNPFTSNATKKNYLLTEKAYQLIQQAKMQHITKQNLLAEIEQNHPSNIYQFIKKFI